MSIDLEGLDVPPRAHTSPGILNYSAVPVPKTFLVGEAESYRTDPRYHEWYYAQNPRDPRLPPPIHAMRVANDAGTATGTAAGTGTKPDVSPQDPTICLPKNLFETSPSQEAIQPVPNQDQPQQPPQQLQRPQVARPQPQVMQTVAMAPQPVQPNSPNMQVVGLMPVTAVHQHQPHQGPPPMQAGDHSGQPRACQALERYRASKSQAMVWDLDAVKGSIPDFCMDQDGSRLIQRFLADGDNAIDSVFAELEPHIKRMMIDVFGNYVIQKIMEVGKPHHIAGLVNGIKGDIVALSLQTYSCRVLQKLLEVCAPADQDAIARELECDVARCVQDQNGNHVVQKIIEVIPDRAEPIIRAFHGRVLELSTHAYGCRVLQRIFERCKNPAHTSQLISEVVKHIPSLTGDQYGNYVIQHVLINGTRDTCRTVISKLGGQLDALSTGKFSSNVAERVFLCADDTEKQQIIDLMLQTNGGTSGILNMMQDRYANYVFQKVFDNASVDQRVQIVRHIDPYVPMLRKNNFGKHIIMRLEKVGCFGPDPAAALRPGTKVFQHGDGNTRLQGGGRGGEGGGHGGGRGGGRGRGGGGGGHHQHSSNNNPHHQQQGMGGMVQAPMGMQAPQPAGMMGIATPPPFAQQPPQQAYGYAPQQQFMFQQQPQQMAQMSMQQPMQMQQLYQAQALDGGMGALGGMGSTSNNNGGGGNNRGGGNYR